MITAGHHSYRKTAVIEIDVQAGSPLAPVTEYVAPAPAVVRDVPATVIASSVLFFVWFGGPAIFSHC